MTTATTQSTITDHEAAQVERANATRATPVVFVHGLWLLPSSREGISEIADYEEAIIRRLDRKPVIVGHSFGGLLTMILAGRGLAAASVSISPAPFRGVPRRRRLG